jgi:hypothetical protein
MDLNHIDYEYFEKKIKPVLLHRCPSFENLKLVNAWSGYYEYNTLDQNLIIGFDINFSHIRFIEHTFINIKLSKPNTHQ